MKGFKFFTNFLNFKNPNPDAFFGTDHPTGSSTHVIDVNDLGTLVYLQDATNVQFPPAVVTEPRSSYGSPKVFCEGWWCIVCMGPLGATISAQGGSLFLDGAATAASVIINANKAAMLVIQEGNYRVLRFS